MASQSEKLTLSAQARHYREDAILFLKSVMYGDERFVDKAGRTHPLEVAPITERIKAANALLDRGYGRPAQAVHVGTDEETAGALRVIVEHIRQRGTTDSNP